MAWDQTDFENAMKDSLDYMYPLEREWNKDFDFYALRQWDEQDLLATRRQKRPALIFDRTRPIIDAVSGAEITNRYEPKFLPRNVDLEEPDSFFSEAGSNVLKYIRQFANAQHEESKAFQSTLICGVGAVELVMDYEDNQDGAILYRRVPVRQFGLDGNSVQTNYRDAKFILRDKWIDEDEVRSLFGKEAVERVMFLSKQGGIWDAAKGFVARQMTREYEDSRRAYADKRGRTFYNPKIRRIHVWEAQYFERTYGKRVFFSDPMEGPKSEIIDNEIADEVIQQISEVTRVYNQQLESKMAQAGGQPLMDQNGQPAQPLPEVQVVEDFPIRKYYKSFHVANEQVKIEESSLKDFSYHFITGYEDWDNDGLRTFFGLMRPMRDPQKYANKFFSQAVHIWASNPKGALLYEEGLFSDKEQAMTDWASPEGTIPVEDGSLQTDKPRFQVIDRSATMTGVEGLLSHALGSVPTSVGVSEQYFVGGVQDLKRTAGQAIQSVQRQTMTTLSNLFDALVLYKKQSTKHVLTMISAFMDPVVLQRVMRVDEQPFAQALLDGELHNEYDVIIEEVPNSQSLQQETFEKLIETNFIPQMLELGVSPPPDLAEFFPFPADIKVQFKAALQQNKQLMDLQKQLAMMALQMQAAQMQAAMAMMQAGGPPPPGMGMPGTEAPATGEQPGGEAPAEGESE
jgi:hypothetical protein